MLEKINIYEAKAKLSNLIAEVEKTNRPITICRNGRPVADLVVHKPQTPPLKRNPLLKGAKFVGDPLAGVDEADWPATLR